MPTAVLILVAQIANNQWAQYPFSSFLFPLPHFNNRCGFLINPLSLSINESGLNKTTYFLVSMLRVMARSAV